MFLPNPKTFIRISGFFGLAVLMLGFFAFTSVSSDNAESIEGAWQQVVDTKDGEVTHVLLISGNYFAWTVHKTADGAFLATKGGSWKKEGAQLSVTYEFHTADSTRVGTSDTWAAREKGGMLQLKGSGMKNSWTQIDQGVSTPLTGPWLFSGRKRDGEIQRVDMTTAPRKTMKILTGTRFQWIAYNTETKQFMGTGGGSYSAENGTYTENIEFFSRDDSRVGASLKFKFEVIDGDWHHSGNNSRGEPMYEFWSRRK